MRCAGGPRLGSCAESGGTRRTFGAGAVGGRHFEAAAAPQQLVEDK